MAEQDTCVVDGVTYVATEKPVGGHICSGCAAYRGNGVVDVPLCNRLGDCSVVALGKTRNFVWQKAKGGES